jgi:hypothetical protein
MGTRAKTGSTRTSKRGTGKGAGIRHVDPTLNRPSNADEQSPETLVPEIVRHDLSSMTASTDALDREARIAKRAYELAEARGFAPGAELEDWLQAEREIAAQSVKQVPPEDQFTG